MNVGGVVCVGWIAVGARDGPVSVGERSAGVGVGACQCTKVVLVGVVLLVGLLVGALLVALRCRCVCALLVLLVLLVVVVLLVVALHLFLFLRFRSEWASSSLVVGVGLLFLRRDVGSLCRCRRRCLFSLGSVP